jgi:hypothetical protein
VKIIERFNSTRLSPIEFCEREEVSRSSLAIWRRKLKSERKSGAKATKRPAFIELTPAPTESPDSPMPVHSGSEFELALPGGVTLRWKG